MAAHEMALPMVQEQQDKAEEIGRLLTPGMISVAFQPVVSVVDGALAAYEAFARFPKLSAHGDLTPDAVLALAGEVGLRDELEVACWAAVTAAGRPPAGRGLIMKISPSSLGHTGLLDLAGGLPTDLVIELTEPPAEPAPWTLRDRLAPWRERRARIAVDESGAGHAALEQLVELRPDYLKLSHALVTSLEHDMNARARLNSLVSFAGQAGAKLIAAGVESEAQLAILHEAGVDLALGSLFGRPTAPWPELERTIVPGALQHADDEPPAPDAPVLVVGSAAQPAPHDRGEAVGPVTPTPAAVEHAEAAGPVTPAPASPGPVLAPAPSLKPDPESGPLATASLIASGQALVDAALDDLASRGLAVTVYVEQHGVLRCRAVRGAWHAADGLAPASGAVGETFRTGRKTRPTEFELCVPCIDRDRVIGVVRVIGEERITDGHEGAADLCARVVGPRLMVTEPPTRAQLLARRARRLTALLDAQDISREALAAALDLTDLRTAALVLRDENDVYALSLADGPVAPELAGLGPEDWALVSSWLDGAAACVTSGLEDGARQPGADRLREFGVRSLAIVALNAAGRRRGLLLAVGDEPAGFDPESVELLELLGHHVAAALEAATAVDHLRLRAALDPATGLPYADVLEESLVAVAPEGAPAAVVVAAVAPGADDDARSVLEIMRRSAPERARMLRAEQGLLLVFAPEGAAHAQTLAALIEARGSVVLGTALATDVLFREGDEGADRLRARAEEMLAALLGASPDEELEGGGDGFEPDPGHPH